MAEYIERDVALNALCQVSAPTPPESYIVEKCIDKINDVPAADVVEVVRCKDCENCYPVRLRNGEVYFYKCEFHDIEVEPDDFCSRAERRTDNG